MPICRNFSPRGIRRKINHVMLNCGFCVEWSDSESVRKSATPSWRLWYLSDVGLPPLPLGEGSFYVSFGVVGLAKPRGVENLVSLRLRLEGCCRLGKADLLCPPAQKQPVTTLFFARKIGEKQHFSPVIKLNNI